MLSSQSKYFYTRGNAATSQFVNFRQEVSVISLSSLQIYTSIHFFYRFIKLLATRKLTNFSQEVRVSVTCQTRQNIRIFDLNVQRSNVSKIQKFSSSCKCERNYRSNRHENTRKTNTISGFKIL